MGREMIDSELIMLITIIASVVIIYLFAYITEVFNFPSAKRNFAKNKERNSK